MVMSAVHELGYILSRATTDLALFQPRKESEASIREGMFVVVKSVNGDYLGEIMKIAHYNEYYEVGEVWVDALREGYRPPSEMARRYTVASLRILGILTANGLRSADKPPLPGEPVYPATSQELSVLYKFIPGQQSKPNFYIEIGSMYGYESDNMKLPALLDLRTVNMHLAIIGTTGSGKSNTVGKIIEELGRLNKIKLWEEAPEIYSTLPVMIIDANGDYIDYFEKSYLVDSFSKVKRFCFEGSEIAEKEKIGSVILEKYITNKSIISTIKIDLNSLTPDEIAETIIALYHAGRLEGAELQLNYLSSLLSDNERLRMIPGVSNTEKDIDYNYVIYKVDELKKLIDKDRQDNRIHPTTADAVKRALNTFHDLLVDKHKVIPKHYTNATINETFVDEITNPDSPQLVLIDFSAEGATGVSPVIKQFVVYAILSILYKKFTGYRIRGLNRLLLFVMEEAQNYAPNLQIYPVGFSIAKKVLATVATQGRKFGLCLCLVTQRPSYVDPIVMSMMNTFIIHRISPGDIKFVDTITGGLPRYIKSKLTYMEPGLAVVTGQMNVFPYPVFVRVYRRKSHKMGSLGK